IMPGISPMRRPRRRRSRSGAGRERRLRRPGGRAGRACGVRLLPAREVAGRGGWRDDARRRRRERLMAAFLAFVGKLWERLAHPVDSMLMAAAVALVGGGLVAAFSATGQDVARGASPAAPLRLCAVLCG